MRKEAVVSCSFCKECILILSTICFYFGYHVKNLLFMNCHNLLKE